MAAASASSIASDDGAPTAASTGMPARAALSTISAPARPLTHSTPAARRIALVLQQPARDLVDRVVAADVLAQRERESATVAEGRRVESSGGAEGGLSRPQPPGSAMSAVGSTGGRPATAVRPARSDSRCARPHRPHAAVAAKCRSRRAQSTVTPGASATSTASA